MSIFLKHLLTFYAHGTYYKKKYETIYQTVWGKTPYFLWNMDFFSTTRAI